MKKINNPVVMNKKTLVAVGMLVLLGAGCSMQKLNDQPIPQKSPVSSGEYKSQQNWVPTASAGYKFTCYSGPKAPAMFGKNFNGDLKSAGWQTTDNSDVKVCVRSSATVDEALIITLGPSCDVKRVVGCDHVGIWDANMGPQKKLEPLAFIETSEMYGMSVFNKIIAWGETSLVYRTNGMFPDGRCTEQGVKDIYAQQDRVVDLTSNKENRESVTQTCYLTSCSDNTLRCK